MNIDEMRKKYREIKQGENSNKNISEIHAGRVDESEDEQPYAKTGGASDLSAGNSTYYYDKEANTVTFECDHILNESDSRTGQLFITLWISEKIYKFSDGGWQNDDYYCVESLDLGCLKVGYELSDVQKTFKFSNENIELINTLNEDGREWHFVFTINELHEDGNKYITKVSHPYKSGLK